MPGLLAAGAGVGASAVSARAAGSELPLVSVGPLVFGGDVPMCGGPLGGVSLPVACCGACMGGSVEGELSFWKTMLRSLATSPLFRELLEVWENGESGDDVGVWLVSGPKRQDDGLAMPKWGVPVG